VLFYIPDEVPEAFAGVIAGTLIMDIAKRPLDWFSIMHLQCVGSRKQVMASDHRLTAE
jgi:hypothetical protein